MKRYVWVMILVFLLHPVAAQQSSPIQLTIDQVGYNGTATTRGWIPVVVTLENTGSDVQGVLSVEPRFGNTNGGDYAQMVDLPGGSRKQIRLLYAPFLSPSDIRVTFTVDGRVAAREEYSINWGTPAEALIGGFGTPPATLAGFKFTGTDTTVIPDLPPEQFPSTDAELLNFSVLIVRDVEATPEQVAAVKRWVAAGGVLWFDLSAPQVDIAETWGDLVPVTDDLSSTGRDLEIQLSNTSPLYATRVRDLQSRDEAEIVLRASDTENPILVRDSLGRGAVVASGFDLATIPIDRVAGRQIESLIDLPRVSMLTPSATRFNGQGDDSLPSASLVALMLLGYLFVIGPVNYWILRRLDRREWAWYSIPATVLLFTVISYIAGSSLREIILSANQVSVIEAAPGMSEGRLSSSSSLSSGRRGSWTINLDQEVVAGDPRGQKDWFPSYEQTYLQQSDDTATLADWTFSTGDRKGFFAAGAAPVPYNIESTIERDRNGELVSVTVTNSGSQAIEHGLVVFPAQETIELPVLAPGGSFSFEAADLLPGNITLPGIDWQQTQAAWSLYESDWINGEPVITPLSDTPHVLIGSLDPAVPMSVNGEMVPSTSLTLYVLYLEEQ